MCAQVSEHFQNRKTISYALKSLCVQGVLKCKLLIIKVILASLWLITFVKVQIFFLPDQKMFNTFPNGRIK